MTSLPRNGGYVGETAVKTAVRLLTLVDQVGLGPRDPVRHLHLAVHGGRRAEVFARALPLALPLEERAKSEVAVGDQRPHAARLGKRHRLAIVRLAAPGVESIRVSDDVAAQVQRVRSVSRRSRVR